MKNRMKEEEKIERVIRSLAKLPENRRCINCNSLGPQYVCTTFWTFVCTNCSGIQREFNHRVKSVSMAKFTAEEVSALQAGGNERAKQIYFKEWDPHRHPYPDSNNTPRLRDFIRLVYVDRRFTGERTQNNLPRLRLNDKEESHGSRKICFSRSPRNEDGNDPRSPNMRNEDNSVKYYYDERRSPRYASRNGSFRRNPIKIEVVDDRFRDGEPRSRRHSSLESKASDGQKNVDRGKRVVFANAEESVKENQAEQKINNPETQIDMSMVTSQVSEPASVPETRASTQSKENNWAPFEISTAEEAPQTSNTNTLNSSTTETPKITNAIDFLLSELSGPFYAAATASVSEVPISADNGPSIATVENVSVSEDLPPSTAGEITTFPDNIGASSVTSTTDSQLRQPSMAFASITRSVSLPVRDVPSNNQLTVVPNTDDFSNAFTELSLQATSKPAQASSKPEVSDVGFQPGTVETKSIGRKELPLDLFTTNYLSSSASQAGWRNVQPHNMGYGLQYYPNTVPVSAFPTTAKYTNPFEVAEERTQVHSPPFPTMATLQGAGTAMSSGTGLLRASSFGGFGSMMPQSLNYASPMHPQPAFTSGFPTDAYFEQVNNNMQPSRHRRLGSLNSDITNQQLAGGYMAHNGAPNSFSHTGGNPFG